MNGSRTKLAMLLAGLLGAGAALAGAIDVSRPAQIVFGATVAATEAALTDKCATVRVRDVDMPAFDAGSKRQIDCSGFVFAGAPRQAEFVFLDDALSFVWILTGAEDESELAAALSAVHGAPAFATQSFFAYPDADVALRRDVPEILFYGPAVAEMFEGWFAAPE